MGEEKDCSAEPIEIRLIVACSDGEVKITPKKCAIVKDIIEDEISLLRSQLAKARECLNRNLNRCYSLKDSDNKGLLISIRTDTEIILAELKEMEGKK